MKELYQRMTQNEKDEFMEFVKRQQRNDYEPILDPKNKRFTAFPVTFNRIWSLYKDQAACIWFAEEIDFEEDYSDFLTLTEGEQYFIEMILAFFASSDGIVTFNLSRFIGEIQVTEILYAYQYQTMMENIHSEVYSLMLEKIVVDVEKREKLFGAIKTVESVKMMADWALKWIDSSESFAHRVVAFAIVEGIFFCGAFAAIYWLKQYKKRDGKSMMNGLVQSNKYIARDESQHVLFACEIYSLLQNKLSVKDVYNMVDEGVKISQEFMTDALPVRLINMNSDSMCNYIECVADVLLVKLGYKKLFGKTNPYKFMERIGLLNKDNFFERRPTDYQNSKIKNTAKSASQMNWNKTDDF